MASDKGKAAQSRYMASPAGRESAIAKDARFRATPAGKESAKAYNARFRATPAGRESAKAKDAKYSSSLPGRLAADAKVQNYRKTPHGHEMRASYERKRFRDTDSTLLGEHREQLEDFPEEEYSQGRKAVYDIIKSHVIESNKLAKFNKLKAKLVDSHTSVYLPNLPLIAGEKNSSKKEWKKNVMFARSKSILQWKNTSTRIFKRSLNDEKADKLLKAWFPTMNFETNTTSYKITFAATQLGIKVLNTRDLWIRKLYGSIHQLNIFSENMINQNKLDNPAEEKADQIMGWKLHQNGHEAYKDLLKFSYVDGKPFNFKYDKQSKKSREKRVEAEWCRTSCIPATHDEIDLFKQVLRSCLQLDVRNGRQFIRDSNICPSYDDDTHMYKLIVDKRNHPETCYQSDAADWNGEGPPCVSSLRRLKRLSYHYKKVRSIFNIMNELKVADKFISDFDTATAVGDVAYLLKLLDFKPHYSPKTFELERSHTVVNEATIMETYGHHYTNYLKAISSLPSVPCISCNVLHIADQDHCRLITNRWGKLREEGSEYSKLLEYLQSNEWIRKGGVRVETLIGRRLCNYCWGKMQKGEMPRTSLRNHMDIGRVPPVITALNQFERLFIKLASHFAVYVKLGTTLGKRKSNEKMLAIKGFAVNIPVPMQVNIKDLGVGRPAKLIDPNNFIMLHGLPTKSNVVWKSLVDVNKIFAALEWLIINNPLYNHIRLPDSPEDLLPHVDSQLEAMCDTQGIDGNASSCNSDMECNSESSCLSQSADSSDLEHVSKRPRNVMQLLTDSESDPNGDQGGIRGGCDELDGFCLLTPEEPEWKAMQDTALTVSVEEMAAINNIASVSAKKRYIMMNCIKHMCRMVVSNGTVCMGCSDLIQDFRSKLIDVVGNDYQLFEYKYLKNIFDQLRQSVANEDQSIHDNICSYCVSKNIKDDFLFQKARRTTKRGLSKTFTRRKVIMNYYSRYRAVTMQTVLEKIDRLKESSVLCIKCHKKTEASMTRVIPHYYRATRQNKLKIKLNALDIRDVYDMTLTLEERSKSAQYQTGLSHCCVKCSRCIRPKADLLHQVIPEIFSDTDSPPLSKDGAAYVATRNGRSGKDTIISLEKTDYDNKDAAKNKTENRLHLRTILQCIEKALRESLHCRVCIQDIKDVKFLFRNLQIGWSDTHRVSLKQFDANVMNYLKVHYGNKLVEALENGSCFHCGVTKQETITGGAILTRAKSKATKKPPTCDDKDKGSCSNDVSSGTEDNDFNQHDNDEDDDIVIDADEYNDNNDDNGNVNDKDDDDDDDDESSDEEKVDINDDDDHDDEAAVSQESDFELGRGSDDDIDDEYNDEGCNDELQGSDEGMSEGSEFDWNFIIDEEALDEDCNDFHDDEGNNPTSHVPNVPPKEAQEEGEASHDKETDKGKVEEETQKAMLERMTSEDLNNMIEAFTVTRLDQTDVDESPDLHDELYKLLRLDDDALDMDNSQLDLMAFPEVFSWGVGEKRASTDVRDEKANPLQYEKSRLLSADGSSRRHTNYLFHLSSECERRKIMQSVFSTMKNIPGMGPINAGTILAKIKNKDDSLLKNVSKVLRLVPNTAAYWKSARNKLRAQIAKFGAPTFFLTFSPAEYDWPDLIAWLRERNSDIPNVDQLSPAALMNLDPVLTSTYIHQRFNALWDFIIKAEPLGKVRSWFIRNEYQSRGTCHFHCFLWCTPGPVLGHESDDEVAAFVQKHITCRIPSPVEEGTLHNIVTRYQDHNCRSYCLRSFGKGGTRSGPKAACRFGFPRVKAKRFTLHSVLSCVIGRKSNKMRKRLYDLARSEEERRINDYNDVLSFLWAANMDIQFVSESSHSIAEYVTKYATKGEKSELKDFKPEISNTKSVYANFLSNAYKFLKLREMGAHEATDRILQNGGEMWRSSEKFQWLPAAMPKGRSRTLKPLSVIQNQDPNSKKIFYDNYIDPLYPNRPNTPEFVNMSLHDFVLKFDKTALPATTKGDDVTKYQKIHHQETGQFIRTLRRRTKEPVLYHHYYSVHEKPEEFYYSMLFLHKPWRSEKDILGDSTTYQQEYFNVVESWPRLKEMSSRLIDIQKAREKMETDAEKAAREVPEDQNQNTTDNDEPQGIVDFQHVNNQSDIETLEQLEETVRTLNTQQRKIYDEVTQKLENMVTHEESGCTDKCEKDCNKPLLLYVSGFGGTGKSYLIRALKGYIYVRKHVFNEPTGILIVAPTGLAARNISGQTIHSAFMFIVEHGKKAQYVDLDSSRLQKARRGYRDMKLMITDECSMCSAEMIFAMDLRLQQIFPKAEQPFGGKCAIMFGDLLQLPPVNGQKPFVALSSDQTNEICRGFGIPMDLWSLFQFRELSVNQRQAGSKNLTWSNILNRVRIGTQTQEDVSMLQERLVPLVKSDVPNQYLDQIIDFYWGLPGAICLFPLRSMVKEFNDGVLKKHFSSNTTVILAIDEVDGRTKSDKRKAQAAVDKMDSLHDSKSTGNLEKVLALGEGVRIMLRKNVNTAIGLVNGAMGTVVELIREGDKEDSPVEQLRIQFDDHSDAVLISRDMGKREIFPGSFLKRRQFPISLGYATSIHKAQGMSLTTVLCDLGQTVFDTGQTYVALSRCKTLQGLHLINFSPSKIMVDAAAINEYIKLGSVPVCEGQHSDTATFIGKAPDAKILAPVQERIWYTTRKAKKGRSTINAAIDASLDPKSKTGKGKKIPKKKPKVATSGKPAPSGKKPKPSKTSKPAQPTRRPSRVPQPSKNQVPPRRHLSPPPPNINGLMCVQKIVNDVPQHLFEQFHQIIGIEDLNKVYSQVMCPWSRSSNHRDDNFLNRLAKRLDPDPFGAQVGTSKWLTDEHINKYLAVLKDDNLERGLPSICHMGSCGYSVYTNTYTYVRRHRLNEQPIKTYIDAAFAEKPFSRLVVFICRCHVKCLIITVFNFIPYIDLKQYQFSLNL